MSLKVMHPDSAILATGGFMLADKLKPYLDKKDISLALGQDKIGLEMTKYLSGHFPKAQRIHLKAMENTPVQTHARERQITNDIAVDGVKSPGMGR